MIKVQSNIGEARAILERAREMAMNMEPFMEVAGSIVEASVRERFRTSKGPGGIPWPPSNRQRYSAQPGKFSKSGKLSMSKASREAIGPNPGGRTLVDTGSLESSITYRVAGNSVTIGFIAKTRSAKYAYVHQFGATIVPRAKPYLAFRGPDGHWVFTKKVVIPARPMLGIDDWDRQDLMEGWKALMNAELGNEHRS